MFSIGEADREIAFVCGSEGHYGVLSSDSDFISLEGVPRWLDYSSFKIDHNFITVECYDKYTIIIVSLCKACRGDVCSYLHILPIQLPLFSTLLGNDFFSCESLRKRICRFINPSIDDVLALAQFVSVFGFQDPMQIAANHHLLKKHAQEICVSLEMLRPTSPTEAAHLSLGANKLDARIFDHLLQPDCSPILRQICFLRAYHKGPSFELPNKPHCCEITRPIRNAICNLMVPCGEVVRDVSFRVQNHSCVSVPIIASEIICEGKTPLQVALEALEITSCEPLVKFVLDVPFYGKSQLAASVISIAFLWKQQAVDRHSSIALLMQAILLSVLHLDFDFSTMSIRHPYRPDSIYYGSLFLHTMSMMKALSSALQNMVPNFFLFHVFDGPIFCHLHWELLDGEPGLSRIKLLQSPVVCALDMATSFTNFMQCGNEKDYSTLLNLALCSVNSLAQALHVQSAQQMPVHSFRTRGVQAKECAPPQRRPFVRQ